MMKNTCKLISYIAPAAPATRRPVTGSEPFLRPEIGFTPRWYARALGINFSEKWHTNPGYRKESILQMRSELRSRFPDTNIGQIQESDSPVDVLTGTFGACTVAGIYGIPIRYSEENWPVCENRYLTADQIKKLEPPDLTNNSFFNLLLQQLEWIRKEEGIIRGFLNWQGILNNAHRLRGPDIFLDFYENPGLIKHLFECVCTTMIEAATILHREQEHSGFSSEFFTVSNCLVNMVSNDIYREFLLPCDLKLAEQFGCLGIHNCAWKADAYLESYAEIKNVGYIDMGKDSDLTRARNLFPNSKRAIMYSPVDLKDNPISQIRIDLETIARNYGPCDIVAADIEHGTPDLRILEFYQQCREISKKYE